MCPSYQTSNISPCGLAEEFLVPEWNVSRGGLIRLPDCIRALNKCGFEKGDDIAVFGAGPAGLMHVLLAKAFAAGRIFVIDVNDFRLDFARRYGVLAFNAISDSELAKKVKSETGERGVDVCVVATGSMNALLQSFDLTRKGGTIILFCVPPK